VFTASQHLLLVRASKKFVSSLESFVGIPTDAIAYKGKDKLDENYVIQPNDNLEFHRRAGEKG